MGNCLSGVGGSVVRHNQQMSAEQRGAISTLNTYLRQAEQSGDQFTIQAMRLALELYGSDNYAPRGTSERARLDDLYDFSLLQIARRLGVEHTTRSGAIASAEARPEITDAPEVTVLANSDNRAEANIEDIPTATMLDGHAQLEGDSRRQRGL